MQKTTTGEPVVDVTELERRALNDVFSAREVGWHWDAATFASLRRVGATRAQLDEYGFRTGDLLTYGQLVELDEEVSRRLGEIVLDLASEQPDAAWVA